MRAVTIATPPKRLLVIAGVFPPAGGGGALRMVKLLKHLPRFGWEPRVIAPRGRSGWFADPALLEEVAALETTRVGWPHRGRTLEGLRRRVKDPEGSPSWLTTVVRWGARLRDVVAVPDEHLLWSTAAAHTALRLTRDHSFDLLLTASFPYSCHLAGLVVRHRRRMPWIADFADPWVGLPFRGQDRGARRFLDARMEGAVLAHADAITLASPGMQRILNQRHPELRGKLHQLHNTFDAQEFAGTLTPPERSTFEILFVGTFDSRATPPAPIVQGLRGALLRYPNARDRLRVRVLGGADLASARYVRDQLGESRQLMSFEGYVTHAEAIQAMRRADLLFLSVAPGAHWHLTAKVFEYLASRRPILAAVPAGDCRDLLQRCGGARLIEPGDEEGMVRALGEAIEHGRVEPDSPRNEQAIAELAAIEVARGAAELMDRVARHG